jgi:hypothetical protein
MMNYKGFGREQLGHNQGTVPAFAYKNLEEPFESQSG